MGEGVSERYRVHWNGDCFQVDIPTEPGPKPAELVDAREYDRLQREAMRQGAMCTGYINANESLAAHDAVTGAENRRLRAALSSARRALAAASQRDPTFEKDYEDADRALRGLPRETESVQPNPIGPHGGIAAPGRGIPDAASAGVSVNSRLEVDAPDHRSACGAEGRHSERSEPTAGVPGNAGAPGGSSFERQRASGMEITELPKGVLQWLSTGERGVSSETIVEHLYGIPLTGRWGKSHPYDPDDLRRCLLLLQASPETRDRLNDMATCSSAWARLIARWDELERLFLEEAGANGLSCTGWSAPRTYKAMKDILNGDGLRR